MIPIRDHNKAQTFPFVNYFLITINVLVFGYMLTLPENLLQNFVVSYALIPAEIVSGVSLYTLFTSMFLHGGFAHIIGNMLFIFARRKPWTISPRINARANTYFREPRGILLAHVNLKNNTEAFQASEVYECFWR